MRRTGSICLATLSIAFAMYGSVALGSSTPVAQDPSPQVEAADGLPRSAVFRHLGPEQGLSDRIVNEIAQDRDGFMWFGTTNGLYRYDGYRFLKHQHTPADPYSIGGNLVTALFAAPDGKIWVGGRGVGLNAYDPATQRFTRYRHDPTNDRALSSDSPRTIYRDRLGTLWIGTERGLNRLDDATRGVFTRYLHDAASAGSERNTFVLAVTEDRAGGLWVGTAGGLNRLNRETGAFTSYRHDPADPRSLPNARVFDLLVDSVGVLWVATDGGGLARLDDASGNGSFTHYRHDPANPNSLSADSVDSLLEDDAGRIWIGTFGGGLSVLDHGQFTVYRHDPSDVDSLSFDQIGKLLRDRSGLLWIGTGGGGVDIFNPRQTAFTVYSNDPEDTTSLASNFVTAVYEDRAGNVWVGTRNRGLDRLDLPTGQATHYPFEPGRPGGLGHAYVSAIRQGHSGDLWIATYGGGLYRLDPQTGVFSPFRHNPADPRSLSSDNVYDISVDETGAVWVAALGGGLDRFEPSSGGFTHYRHDPSDPSSLSNNTVLGVAADGRGSIWVGVAGEGLHRLDVRSGAFTRFRHDPGDPRSISDNSAYTVFVDRGGAVWVGTRGAGLNRFDPTTETFVQFHEPDGLASETVYAIVEDGAPDDPAPGNLWISTANGLSRLDRDRATWRTFDATDGLPREALNVGSHRASDGRLLIGSLGGLIAVGTADLVKDPFVPPVVFTDFLLDHAPVPIGNDSPLSRAIGHTERVEIPAQVRALSIEFAALSYQAPTRNRYRYMLQGFDANWIEVDASRRLITYTNLDPGTYVFRVMGSNGDGVWNPAARTLAITILPPWWESGWFLVTTLFALSLSAVVIYFWRVRVLRANGARLEQLVRVRTRELASVLETRDEFLRTLAHDLKTPLAALRWQVQLLLQDADEGLLEASALKSRLQRVAARASEAGRSIDELHDLTRLAAGAPIVLQREYVDLVAIAAEVAAAEGESDADSPPAPVGFVALTRPLTVAADRGRLVIILSNLVDNARKYSPPDRDIVVRVTREVFRDRPHGVVSVIDHGRGIPADDVPHIFERHYRGGNVGSVEGQGLGLASVRQLVELHQGRVTVESQEGHGTTVSVWLPLADHPGVVRNSTRTA